MNKEIFERINIAQVLRCLYESVDKCLDSNWLKTIQLDSMKL